MQGEDNVDHPMRQHSWSVYFPGTLRVEQALKEKKNGFSLNICYTTLSILADFSCWTEVSI